jgi:hypothetical protein
MPDHSSAQVAKMLGITPAALFQDKTALHFVIDPGFTLETGYADWKTGNWRRIKLWPLIRSRSLRV